MYIHNLHPYFLNGHFDSSSVSQGEYVVSEFIDRTSRKGKCFVLKHINESRSPSGISGVSLCHPNLEKARVGDVFMVKTKLGSLKKDGLLV